MHGGFGVEPGSAARDAEQRARETEPSPFRNTVGMRLGAQVGRKFELESRPSGPGEARPVEQAPVAPAPQAEAQPAPPEKPPSGAARLWDAFRGLFSRK